MRSKGLRKRPVHAMCGGGYGRIEDALDGRPRFKCTKCGDTWTEGKSGGESLEAVNRALKKVRLTQAERDEVRRSAQERVKAHRTKP